MDILQGVESPQKMTISPGPFTLMIDENDAIAAELINWLSEKMGDDVRVGDMLHVLDSARWWVITFTTWHESTMKPKIEGVE